MSDKVKTELISAGNTFLATFLTVVATTISAGGVEWTTAFWASVALAGARAAVKAVIAQFVPVKLGGVK